jgi:hypothetical protein
MIIGGELSQGESERLIILLVEYVSPEVWFQNCIDTFHFAINFGMEYSRESQLDSESCTELLPEATCKLWLAFQDNSVMEPMKSPNMQEHIC